MQLTVETAVSIGANLYGARLVGASLVGASLVGANLDGARLDGANLDGARYGENIPLTTPPIQIMGLRWPILILDTHIKIGCELHLTSEWAGFKDSRVNLMDPNAVDFWTANKELILLAAKLHQTK